MNDFTPKAISWFQKQVQNWFSQYGRKTLPWQQRVTPYRVWISEIMLQQTQVQTVIPYFQRFMRHFPNLKRLATGELDEVLTLWAGLGYYARARNLHRCAQIIHQQYHGKWPDSVETLITLPGIGRSTAGAICSLAFHKPSPILDGNVKRILCRFHAISGYPEQSAVKKQLWAIAQAYTPKKAEFAANYCQVMMDLGALICRRSKPNCPACPLQKRCQAYQQQTVSAFPEKRPKGELAKRSAAFLLLENNQQQLLLIKRPNSGIWGGLWSLPTAELATAEELQYWAWQQFGLRTKNLQAWSARQHQFSHFQLSLLPFYGQITQIDPLVNASSKQIWFNRQDEIKFATATPIYQLLLAWQRGEKSNE